MKWIPLILKHLRQNWIRTASTAATIAVCIFLFCTLQTFVASLLIGRVLADQFHWKIGETVQLTSNIYQPGQPFDFVISALYQTDQKRYPSTNESTLFFHHKYLDEATGETAGVRTYRVEIAEPPQAGMISQAIDDLFENSGVQTHTETEAQYRASAGILGGHLVLLLNGIGVAVMFTLFGNR